jgi:thiamine biosynthesis protein ThiS
MSESIQIQLNGERRVLAAPSTVLDLLGHLGIDPRVVAVELNRVVVKRARYGEAVIEQGAEVEIVSFVGGG